MTKRKINTFPSTVDYVKWCLANGLDPNDEDNEDAYAEWKSNSE